MTNADKMRELVGAPDAPDSQIKQWAYMNRVWLLDLPDEPEFAAMRKSVEAYEAKQVDFSDEHANWDGFLKAEYMPMEVTPHD